MTDKQLHELTMLYLQKKLSKSSIPSENYVLELYFKTYNYFKENLKYYVNSKK